MLVSSICIGLLLASNPGPGASVAAPQPIPDSFEISPIVVTSPVADETLLSQRRRARELRREIRALRYKHFSSNASPELKLQGLEKIASITDPLSLAPLAEELADSGPEVQKAVIIHLSNQGVPGQVELARIAVFGNDLVYGKQAAQQLTQPASPEVVAIFEQALRGDTHRPANVAAQLANTLNINNLIPLLITGQFVTTGDQGAGTASAGGRGDIAQIAVITQRAYVSGLIPVVGDNAGAFQPVVSIVNEGVVMRVLDAVVIEYRTVVHDSLLAMTETLPDVPDPECDWDILCWQAWYNQTYLPTVAESCNSQTETVLLPALTNP